MDRKKKQSNNGPRWDFKNQIMQSDLDRLDRNMKDFTNRLDKLMEADDQQSDFMKKHQEVMMEVEENQKLMLILLKGNELDSNDHGLVGELRGLHDKIEKHRADQDKRISHLERFRDRAIFWFAGFSFAMGSLITFAIYVIKYWKK